MIFKRRTKKVVEISPDEIFLDSQNLPRFDRYQFEGRIEKPISKNTFFFFAAFFVVISVIFCYRIFDLSVVNGQVYAERSKNNSLRHDILIAPRGVIYDRVGEKLAWNAVPAEGEDFSVREYIQTPGFAHLLGFLKYPAKDSSGFYYREEYEPEGGVELYLNEIIGGSNGLKITETDAAGEVISANVLEKPRDGERALLSIDARVQAELYQAMSKTAKQVNFKGGSGVILDVRTGEILALANFPEYDLGVMNKGEDEETLSSYFNDPDKPFLNRAISGLYAPGSIVKPFIGFAALEESVISPEKEILSTGQISIPNPYFPDKPSIFKDWKAHGYVDMRKALAVSSDVYFYEIGGGFQSQRGLGIERIEKYMRLFGFGAETGIDVPGEELGLIPNPEWKKNVFGEEWRLGDTYNTTIGQYGTLVTPIQVARATAALANGGYLVAPTFLKQATTTLISGEKVEGELGNFQVVREGMRMAVTEGTATGLSKPEVKVAAKTGTAEVGAAKKFVNSWSIGFFPYENPRYAFAVVMERGPYTNLVGATYVMRQVMDWMVINTPEYIK